MRSQIAEHFSDSPDYQPDTEASVNGEPRRLIVAKHKSELTQKMLLHIQVSHLVSEMLLSALGRIGS